MGYVLRLSCNISMFSSLGKCCLLDFFSLNIVLFNLTPVSIDSFSSVFSLLNVKDFSFFPSIFFFFVPFSFC